jgi:hypothetical protein
MVGGEPRNFAGHSMLCPYEEKAYSRRRAAAWRGLRRVRARCSCGHIITWARGRKGVCLWTFFRAAGGNFRGRSAVFILGRDVATEVAIHKARRRPNSGDGRARWMGGGAPSICGGAASSAPTKKKQTTGGEFFLRVPIWRSEFVTPGSSEHRHECLCHLLPERCAY